MTVDLRTAMAPALARLDAWRGRTVIVTESISRNRALGHDPNFASQSQFSMTLAFVGETSGGHISLDGAGGAQYQIAILDLTDVLDDGESTLYFIERIGDTAERRSTIKLKS
jgi:hypothetical protein